MMWRYTFKLETEDGKKGATIAFQCALDFSATPQPSSDEPEIAEHLELWNSLGKKIPQVDLVFGLTLTNVMVRSRTQEKV